MIKGSHLRLLLKDLHCISLDDLMIKVSSDGITMQIGDPFKAEEFQGLKKAFEAEMAGVPSGGRRATQTPAKESIDIDGADDIPIPSASVVILFLVIILTQQVPAFLFIMQIAPIFQCH